MENIGNETVTGMARPVGHELSLPQNYEKLKKQGIRVVNRVADFCNRLPFAGKISLTPLATDFIKETNPYYLQVKAVGAAGTLGLMVLAHAGQALMGANNLGKNLEMVGRDPTPEHLIACGLDVAYTIANCSAVYAQLHMSGRLVDHFKKTREKSVPRLETWGIKDGEVDYWKVATHLLDCMSKDKQGDIDTFFMILPKEDKERVMKSMKTINESINNVYSHEEIDQRVGQLDKDIKVKSKLRYVVDIVKHDRRTRHKESGYSWKEELAMLTMTIGGQFGFLTWG